MNKFRLVPEKKKLIKINIQEITKQYNQSTEQIWTIPIGPWHEGQRSSLGLQLEHTCNNLDKLSNS